MTAASEVGVELVPAPTSTGPGSVTDLAAWDRVLDWLQSDKDGESLRSINITVEVDSWLWDKVTDPDLDRAWLPRYLFMVVLTTGQDLVVQNYYGYGNTQEAAAEEALVTLLAAQP